MKLEVVNSFIEYIELLNKIGSDCSERWFRGQSKCEYRLSPTALRTTYAIKDQRGNKIECPYQDNPCSGSNNEVALLLVDEMIKEFRKKVKFI